MVQGPNYRRRPRNAGDPKGRGGPLLKYTNDKNAVTTTKTNFTKYITGAGTIMVFSAREAIWSYATVFVVVMVSTGTIRRAKIVTANKPAPNFTGRVPHLSPNQQCQSTRGRNYHIPRTCSPQAHPGSSNPVLAILTAPGYLEGMLLNISATLWRHIACDKNQTRRSRQQLTIRTRKRSAQNLYGHQTTLRIMI